MKCHLFLLLSVLSLAICGCCQNMRYSGNLRWGALVGDAVRDFRYSVRRLPITAAELNPFLERVNASAALPVPLLKSADVYFTASENVHVHFETEPNPGTCNGYRDDVELAIDQEK